jgi:phosphopantothenate synthetase
MRAKRLVVLLVGLAAVAVVWVGLMAQSRETTYIVLLREKVSPSALIAMKGNRVAVKRALMETCKANTTTTACPLTAMATRRKSAAFPFPVDC